MNTNHMVFLVIAAVGVALLVMSGLALFGHRVRLTEEDDELLEHHKGLPRVRSEDAIAALQDTRQKTRERRQSGRPDRGDTP